MESIIEGRMAKKAKSMFNNYSLTSSDINKEREKILNAARKTRIRKELYNMKNNNNYNYEETAKNTLNNNSDDLFIQNLNIDSHLKNEKYINELLCSNTFDKIFEYIKEIYNNNNFKIDLIKYGLFLLNEKILNLENETKNALIKK